jgi:hypothetical protein
VLQGFHASIEKDVYDCLSLRGSLNARNTLGGTAPAQVRRRSRGTAAGSQRAFSIKGTNPQCNKVFVCYCFRMI